MTTILPTAREADRPVSGRSPIELHSDGEKQVSGSMAISWSSRLRSPVTVVMLLGCFGCFGCQTPQPSPQPEIGPTWTTAASPSAAAAEYLPLQSRVQAVTYQSGATATTSRPAFQPDHSQPVGAIALPFATLVELEALAVSNNPTLRRMQQEANAEWARAGYADKLPDPTVSSMFFGNAMDFVPDRQLAEVQVMQMIPWLSRLSAEAQRAQLEALAAETMYQAERQRVIGDLRANWYRLYVLGKQIRTMETDTAQLESLIKTANARVATGIAQPGDVLMASLELSSVQEQLLGLRQQFVATTAELNRLAGREAFLSIDPPISLEVEMPAWDYQLLRRMALEAQPELAAAKLRAAASRCGIDVARLKRRPDLSFGAGWMVMAADPADTMPGAGDDAWTLNFSASVPMWHRKYDAMVAEASQRYYAASATEEEVALRLDAQLRDLWEQAMASHQTVRLYETSILPQARQTFEADQQSLINNTVTFDRVVRNYRTLINLELGYHRALGQLATTLARIRQTVGVDLRSFPESGHR